MFGFFKKKFDAQKDLSILAFSGDQQLTVVPETGSFRLVTKGLHAYKRPELEIAIGPGLERAAAALLNMVAEYCANTKPIVHGQSWGTTLAGCLVAVRALERHGRLRLVDVDGSSANDEAPIALTTMQFVRGMTAIETKRDEAIQAWRDAIAFYPGTAFVNRTYSHEGKVVNAENALCYLALAAYDDSPRRDEWYRHALERSPVFLGEVLGTARIPALNEATLRTSIATLLGDCFTAPGTQPVSAEELAKIDGLKGAELMTMVPSPLVTQTQHGLSRSVSVMPAPMRAYFYEQPVRERLTTDETATLAIEIYQALRNAPAALASQLIETQNIYVTDRLDPKRITDSKHVDEPTLACTLKGDELPVLSRILADLGRRFAAGLTDDEVRMVYGLTKADAPREVVQQKMTAFLDRESVWLARAMGFDGDSLLNAERA